MKSETLGVIGYLTLAAYIVLTGVYYAATFRNLFESGATTGASPSVTSVPASTYLLSIPAIAAGILVSTAWYFAGKKKQNTVFKITGVVGYIQLVSTVVFIVLLAGVHVVGNQGQQSISAAVSSLVTVLVVVSVIGILSLVSFVLQVISLFSAAKVLGSRYFRFAGFGLIASVLIGIFGAVAAVASVFASVISFIPANGQAASSTISTQVANSMSTTLSTTLGLVVIPFAISYLLAAWGFDNATDNGVPAVGAVEPAVRVQ